VPGVPAGALGEASVSGPLKLAVAPKEDKQRERCIQFLEEALAEARNGRGFDAVFIYATHPDSLTTRHFRTCGFSLIQVVGVLEYAKHEVLADMHGVEGEPPPRPEPLT
jgi:hypothetical protein